MPWCSGHARNRTSPSPTDAPSSPSPIRPAPLSFEVSSTAKGPGSILPPAPFTTHAIDKNAFDNASSRIPFHAILAFWRDSFGPSYVRLETPEDVNRFGTYGHGSGMRATFLDSADGVADNLGNWVVHASLQEHTEQPVISATENVTRWDPLRAISRDLGAPTTWLVWSEAVQQDSLNNQTVPGVILVYGRADGSRDFLILGNTPRTITAQGWVYAFYVTDGQGIREVTDLVFLVPR